MTGAVSVGEIAWKTPDQVQALLGPARHTERIERIPEWTPGEISTYDLGHGHTAEVRFYRARAVSLIVYLEPAARSADDALASVGATEVSLHPTTQTPVARRYTGEIDGVRVDEVILSGSDREWGMVVVKFSAT
jgi:hypothetical protein